MVMLLWEVDNDVSLLKIVNIGIFTYSNFIKCIIKTGEIVVVDEPVLTRETMFYTLDELLSAGEKRHNSIKSSMYFSAKSKTPPTVVNHEIIRAIVGMLNAKGGTLLIKYLKIKIQKIILKKASKVILIDGSRGRFKWFGEWGL